MDFYRVFLKSPVLEKLTLYSINPEESFKIDPSAEKYFISGPEGAAELSRGEYYFIQFRKENLNKSELLEAAMELQKEALWNRLKPESKLFVRSLFEDNSPVIQLWRPLLPSTL